MGGTVAELLPLAMVVAIFPIPIIVVILMLLSPRPQANGTGFALGWLVGLALGTGLTVFLADIAESDSDSTNDDPATWALWTKIIVGSLLLLLAARKWQRRPTSGEEAALPNWMSAIDGFSVPKATGLGFLLSALSPKNLLIFVAAAVVIGNAGFSGRGEVIAAGLFVLIASSLVVLPVLNFLLARRRIAPVLVPVKSWLAAHNNTMMAVLLALIGLVQLLRGITGLL